MEGTMSNTRTLQEEPVPMTNPPDAKKQERMAFSEEHAACFPLGNSFPSCVQGTLYLSSLPRRPRAQLLLPYNTSGKKQNIWDPHLFLWIPPRAAQRQLWREASSPFPQPEGHLDGKEHIYGFLSWQDIPRAGSQTIPASRAFGIFRGFLLDWQRGEAESGLQTGAHTSLSSPLELCLAHRLQLYSSILQPGTELPVKSASIYIRTLLRGV